MRHNRFIGWDKVFDVLARVERVSPWLSRQMARRAAEMPFWFSGLTIEEWHESQVRVHMPCSLTTQIDHEISYGHLSLGAELTLRLQLLRYREEFPFRYRLLGSRVDVHHVLDQALEYRFALPLDEWDRLRRQLGGEGRVTSELVLQAFLADGRAAATFTFTVGFQLEKLLSA